MADSSDKKTTSSGGEFFNVGAPLHAVRPGYVRRQADEQLFSAVVSGHYAHVIAPDRTGKSSLIAATTARLQNNGISVANLDLAQISERDGGSDAGRWYYSIAYRLLRQLRIKVDLQTWWQDKSFLGNRQRLFEFYSEVVLPNVGQPIVVFVDEVQCAAELGFADQLLISIRAAFNARNTEPEFSRLSFVLIGECDPDSLVTETLLSPFTVAHEIHLTDFSREDLNIFSAELNLSSTDAEVALDRIYYWTGGQPYLSQKLSRAVARERIESDIAGSVDRLAMHQLAGKAATYSEPHMSHLHKAVLKDRKRKEALLTLYGKVRKGLKIAFDVESRLHRRLRAIGLVVVDKDNLFKVRNRAYESVFTGSWANENLPMHWRGPVLALALLLALTAIPFAYTQLLPKPYMRVMSTASLDLSDVADAYVNLRSFPGHANAADRMFRSVLENRARQADSRGSIQEIVRFAAQLPAESQFAANLRAEFWDRQTTQAMRQERRDDALLASIESLVVPSQERRRRAATLIGDDYSSLFATVSAQNADGVVLDREVMQLSYYTGAEVSQWLPGDQALQLRESWTLSALEVTPLVRRVIVDRDGNASRVGLTINVSHARLDDMIMRVIAPSGRTAEFVIDQNSSAANEEIRIDRELLSPLLGEAINGTWSLSLRDEATGVSGHLISWSLNINSQVVVESFERGLDIPDPVERPSENLWFSEDGRYAVARALQSDSARIWDLRFGQAARTIAVPAAEQVLGLSANAEYLLTTTQNSVNLWRTSDGRRHATLDVGSAASDALLSTDRLHLLVPNRSDAKTEFVLWSIDAVEVIARLEVAGTPALVSLDSAATLLATADYDRAIRVWNLRSGELVAQLDVLYQPSEITLSATGETIAAVHGNQGVTLWSVERPNSPLINEQGNNEWHMSFSPSGARFATGNHRDGFQVYRSIDGTPSGPLLDSGLRAANGELLSFAENEEFLITAAADGIARFWEVPAISSTISDPTGAESDSGHHVWRESGDLVSALSPGGGQLAIGDASGHVHIQRVDANLADLESNAEEISFLGHRGAVVDIKFSDDGALVASAGSDGSIRIWHADDGQPRSFYGRASASTIDEMAFSPHGKELAVLSGQRIWTMSTETGEITADIPLTEMHQAMVFAKDNQIYLGSESGVLRSMYADRTGNWHLKSAWQGESAIRNLAVSPGRQQMIVVDAQNIARLLDPADGRVGVTTMQLPGAVSDIAISPGESRVVFKTARWLHRSLISPGGLIWTDAIRAPRALGGSRMTFGSLAVVDGEASSRDFAGDSVLILTRDTGIAEIAELGFSYHSGPTLFGNRTGLVAEWTEKLRGPAISGFVREGF